MREVISYDEVDKMPAQLIVALAVEALAVGDGLFDRGTADPPTSGAENWVPLSVSPVGIL